MMSVKLPRTVEEAEQLLEEAVQSCSLPRLNDALKRTHLAGKLCRPAQFTKAVAFRDHLVRVRMEGAPLLHRGELSFKSSEVGDLPQAALSPVLLKSKSLAITREDQDEAKCVVCLDSLRDREVTLLSCGHEFHKSCLEIFLKKADVACYRGAKFPCLLCDKIGQDGATVMGIPQDASVPLVRRDQSSEQDSAFVFCFNNSPVLYVMLGLESGEKAPTECDCVCVLSISSRSNISQSVVILLNRESGAGYRIQYKDDCSVDLIPCRFATSDFHSDLKGVDVYKTFDGFRGFYNCSISMEKLRRFIKLMQEYHDYSFLDHNSHIFSLSLVATSILRREVDDILYMYRQSDCMLTTILFTCEKWITLRKGSRYWDAVAQKDIFSYSLSSDILLVELLVNVNTISTLNICEREARQLPLGELRDEDLSSKLIKAAGEGDCDGVWKIMSELSKRGCLLNNQDECGFTAIMRAASNGHKDVVEILLRAGADLRLQDIWSGCSAMLWAAINGRRDIVKLLLSAGVDVDERSFNDGSTAVMLASAHGQQDVVQMLVDEGGDLLLKDDFGWTAPMRAAHCGHSGVVKVLQAAESDLPQMFHYGQTCLMLAARLGEKAGVQSLIRAGAELDVKDVWNGCTAVMIAADSGHAGIVELLIEAGANLEQVDEWSGHTALMKAASNGHPQVVEMLVRAGADLQLKDAMGNIAAMLAAREGHEAVVALLEKAQVERTAGGGDKTSLAK